ncbi:MULTISPECIES: cadmium resistance transporter [Trichocoleus]|uniref:Cadmium resistance transporter n=1 Tax=Trichocoleus desertorum GB2-A4 TaxID=2933944 RepID=A0ABV0JG60_9CYAN|nr:cadmium resistance transporter [Trichocoleus sp. FACHB-46]MBD1865093.1 cadmium resistance transporter [Trichocoleus sp. FACHB-46]
MNWFGRAVITGVTAFAATNIDDIVILMLFFSQVNANFRPKHIIWGQYLGFTTLMIACLPGFLGGLVIPKAWIGCLGFVPIVIGISHWLNRKQNGTQVQTVTDELSLEKAVASGVPSYLGLLVPQVYHVAAVTLANGGDNIGIYVPLLASSDPASLAVILSVFFVLVGVWCYIAERLTRQPAVARLLTAYGQAIVPFILIGLGLYILVDSGTYRLLPAFSSP